MSIAGTYRLKKAFNGFTDDFEMKFISREDALKLTVKKNSDDGDIMAMMFARMIIEVSETELLMKYDTEFDEIAKKLAKANDMKATDGKYSVIKYTLKKKKGNTYQIKSEDGEEDEEITFNDNDFELAYNTYERL